MSLTWIAVIFRSKDKQILKMTYDIYARSEFDPSKTFLKVWSCNFIKNDDDHYQYYQYYHYHIFVLFLAKNVLLIKYN